MDVARTPPHSANPITHFGEECLLWAPKKRKAHCKRLLRNCGKSSGSSRSLNFSMISVKDDNNNTSLLDSSDRRQTRENNRIVLPNETPLSVWETDSPVRETRLAFQNSTARRIDFGAQGLNTPETLYKALCATPSVFSPDSSLVTRDILSTFSSSASRRPHSMEKQNNGKKSGAETPEDFSPHKRSKWTKLVR